MARYVSQLWNRREFAWYLAIGDLRAQNSNTALGLAWYVLNPLLLAAVYFLVFGIIFAGNRKGDAAFLAYLVGGLFVFQFTAKTMLGGAKTILSNSKLMANQRFPRLLLPISSVVESGLGFLVSLGAFFAVILPIARITPGVGLLWLIPIFIAQVILNIGLTSLTARLTVPFRDLGNVLPFLTRLWLYLSPIIWPLDRLDEAPSWVIDLIHLNPMFYFLKVYRGALLGSEFSVADFGIALAIAIVAFVVGVGAFTRFEGKLGQYL